VLLTTVASYVVLPKCEDVDDISAGFHGLFKSPGCVVIYLVTVGSSMALSSTDPIFSPFMTDKVGLYSSPILSPVSWLCRNWHQVFDAMCVIVLAAACPKEKIALWVGLLYLTL